MHHPSWTALLPWLCVGAAWGCQPSKHDSTTQPAEPAAAATPKASPASPRSLPAFCQATPDVPPLPSTAKATLIRDGFVFVEGPVWVDTLNAFLFSEMDFNAPDDQGPPSKVHRLTLPNTFDVFLPNGGSNGLAVDETGLVACTHDTQTLSRYDLTSKARTVFVPSFESHHFNSPNDVALHSAGHVYFTDPDWQLGKRTSETKMTGVYWRRPDGTVQAIEREIEKPNGIALSPDETRLYVGSVDGTISVFPVLADGSVGARDTFAHVDGPDGMGVDCQGNLYVTSHGPGKVQVLSPGGESIATIDVAPRTTNVAFGGPDRRTLLITAGAGVYSIETAVPGFPY